MQPSSIRRRIFPALLAVLALAACKREPQTPAGVISREKFIAANVAVRTLPDSAPQTRRDAALRKVRVTDKQLRAWVTVHSRDPEMLAKAWEEIAFKVDSIGGASPVAQTPGGITAPPVAAGTPFPPPRGDSVVRDLPTPDSMLANRRRRRNPAPERPELAPVPVQ